MYCSLFVASNCGQVEYLMEETLLVQSLDSLWFFSSVLSSSKSKPIFRNFEGKIAVEEEAENPISEILQSDQNELRNAGFTAKTEKQQSTVSDLGIGVGEEEKSRRRKRRRRRKVLGELELEIDWRYNYERRNELGICGFSEKNLGKMAPLREGMAMKEHIRRLGLCCCPHCSMKIPHST